MPAREPTAWNDERKSLAVRRHLKNARRICLGKIEKSFLLRNSFEPFSLNTTASLPLPAWPPQWPEIQQAVLDCLSSQHWADYRGPAAEQLAGNLAKRAGTERCRLVSSGSIGVETSLRSLGLPTGSRVALCGYDYPGNFRAIELAGFRPLLIDAATHNFSLAPAPLREVPAEELAAVLVSHLYGIPAEIQSIAAICQEKGWRLIEDACQVPGMIIAGKPAGSWGDCGVFSFGGNKPLTAGSGGALLSSDAAIAATWSRLLDRPSDALPIGELPAAALNAQLPRLDDCNQIRNHCTRQLIEQVPWIAGATEKRSPLQSQSAFTQYKLALQCESPTEVMDQLRELGIPAGPGYRSMHRSSQRRCDRWGDLPNCQELEQSLCLIDQRVLLCQGQAREQLIDALNRRSCT